MLRSRVFLALKVSLFITFALIYVVYSKRTRLPFKGRILRNCPQKIVIKMNSEGQLGNQMMDYATAYVAAKELEDHIAVLDNGYKLLNKTFENIILRDLGPKCRHHKEQIGVDFGDGSIGKRFQELVYDRSQSSNKSAMDAFFAANDNVIISVYDWVPILFLKYVNDLKYAFTYKKETRVKIQNTFMAVRRKYTACRKPLLFVGVHVRRGDYANHLNALYNKMQLLGPEFFKNGMKHFRDKYSEHYQVVFLTVSDDLTWVQKYLNSTDLEVVSGDPVADMALLSYCNHTITDYGTFGLWPSLFHGGEHYTTNAYEDFIVAMMYQIKRWTVVNVTKPLVTNSKYSQKWLEDWKDTDSVIPIVLE